MFRVTTLDLKNPLRMQMEALTILKTSLEKETNLTVSGQLEEKYL